MQPRSLRANERVRQRGNDGWGKVQLMLDTASVASRRSASVPRSALLALLVLILLAATAAEARATVGVTNHNDPAGDPAVIPYRFFYPPPTAPVDFALHDGEYQNF